MTKTSGKKQMLSLSVLIVMIFIVCIATMSINHVSNRMADKRVDYRQAMIEESCKLYNNDGSYTNTELEVRHWLEIIEAYDTVLKDSKHYLMMIKCESSGNPTVRPHRDGYKTRGTGCIDIGTAAGEIERHDLNVGELERALYNPHINIMLMVYHFEYLYLKYNKDIRFTMLCYNSGEGRALELRREEKEAGKPLIKYSYYKKHGSMRERLEEQIKINMERR